ncbi:MAG: hypothetical protein AB8H86_12015 [Polyangiales bacterium]
MSQRTQCLFLLTILGGCSCEPVSLGGRDGGVPDSGGCPEEQRECDGVCTEIRSDAMNCGACGNVCASNEDCLGGLCLADLPLEFILEWDTRGDVDLHVVRPDGVLIYYARQRGPLDSGGFSGELDVDDTSGTGPERISFVDPEAGEYLVCVNNFGGVDETTSWNVTIREDDVIVDMLSGTAGPRSTTFECSDMSPDAYAHTYSP